MCSIPATAIQGDGGDPAQLERFTHSAFQVTPYEPYVELAEKLNQLAPCAGPNKTIFVTTGAEAIENAVKIARAATKRSAVIAFAGGFHGRTFMTMALTGKVDPYKKGFGPFRATSTTSRIRTAFTASKRSTRSKRWSSSSRRM